MQAGSSRLNTMKWLWGVLWLSIGGLVALSPASAQITEVGAFTGARSEGWEEFPVSRYLPTVTTILGGGATISGPNMIIYNDGVDSFGLGTSEGARVFDGHQGMGLNAGRSSATLTFATPVTDFGGYWGASTGFGLPDPAPVALSFYDRSGALIGQQNFHYSHSNDNYGQLDWHGWHSNVAIARITYSGDFVVNDGLQIRPVPAPASLLTMLLGLSSGLSFAIRRRRHP